MGSVSDPLVNENAALRTELKRMSAVNAKLVITERTAKATIDDLFKKNASLLVQLKTAKSTDRRDSERPASLPCSITSKKPTTGPAAGPIQSQTSFYHLISDKNAHLKKELAAMKTKHDEAAKSHAREIASLQSRLSATANTTVAAGPAREVRQLRSQLNNALREKDVMSRSLERERHMARQLGPIGNAADGARSGGGREVGRVRKYNDFLKMVSWEVKQCTGPECGVAFNGIFRGVTDDDAFGKLILACRKCGEDCVSTAV